MVKVAVMESSSALVLEFDHSVPVVGQCVFGPMEKFCIAMRKPLYAACYISAIVVDEPAPIDVTLDLGTARSDPLRIEVMPTFLERRGAEFVHAHSIHERPQIFENALRLIFEIGVEFDVVELVVGSEVHAPVFEDLEISRETKLFFARGLWAAIRKLVDVGYADCALACKTS